MFEKLRFGLALAICTPSFLASLPAQADTGELRIAKQYGLAYLPLIVMESEKLYEKRAAELGIATKPIFMTLGNNTAANEALISGSIDVITNGPPGFLIFWSRTKGTKNEVRGIAPLLSQSSWLNTRNPNIKSIRDFTDKDRIALSAVKTSGPAILLQMAAAKAFGEKEYGKLDPLTVSLPHPDGMNMLLAGKTEITAHFTAPPYQNIETGKPGIHTILTSEDVMGGPSTFNLLFTTAKLEQSNPRAIEALVKALGDAQFFIKNNKDKAAEIFMTAGSGSSMSKAEVLSLLNDPGIQYTLTPQKMMTYATFMAHSGTLKVTPGSWKDLFFPYIHDQPGD
jgi:NitT/TauT family transport system substrate-binding protein